MKGMLSGGMIVPFSLRLNILIQAEEVRRVVLILQSRQPIVYGFSVNWKKLSRQLMSGCCCFGYV